MQEPGLPGAAAILAKVRDTTGNLSSFHFERGLLLEATGEPLAPVNLDRFWMGLRGGTKRLAKLRLAVNVNLT